MVMLTWKLCLIVVLPVVAAAALLVTLAVCICRRRRNKDAMVAAAVGGGEKVQEPPWLAGLRSSRPPPDHPMSINPTMTRSPTPPSPSPSPAPSNAPGHHRSHSRARFSPLRPGRPERGSARPEEQAVMEDPLACYSPAISVLLTELDYERLEPAITNDFGRESLLCRRGGPWQVVFTDKKFVDDKGLLTTVTIKRYQYHRTFSEKECKRIREELKGKKTLQHKNLVRLLGYSLGKGRFYLVFDYMSNGNLEQHLFPKAGGPPGLCWQHRYGIVKHVAQGIYPLHVSNVTHGGHGSISASSIMLDPYYTAYIDDHFKFWPDQSSSASIQEEGDAALQADIADFGAVVLEVVCGRRRDAAVVVGNATAPLVDWVWTLHGEGNLLHAVEQNVALDDGFNRRQASKLLLLGLACSHPDPKLRPSIHDVRMVLLDMKPMPEVPLSKPTPKQHR
ncbi:L-type lectin-domain containing receptor kinase VIII.2-like [Phragmites australis]|uniref:L-type lectin-domain containing receptor kinase VIII.2-like n=1 Tax=Phragmites australis TaxID=29695 RepID=UPI002D767B89|nr:L-type lectin-domain containing receptor kinase VIII.2-like [Phragmites australis]